MQSISAPSHRLRTQSQRRHLPTSPAAGHRTTTVALASLLTGLVLLASTAAATEVYQCDGPDGPLFTQTPCAVDAVVRRINVSRPARSESLRDAFAPIALDTSDDPDSNAEAESPTTER